MTAAKKQKPAKKCFEIMHDINFSGYCDNCKKCRHIKEGLDIHVKILIDGRTFLETREETEDEERFCTIGQYNISTPDGKKWFISIVKLSGIVPFLSEDVKAKLGIY
uniref:Uncharacterized protein n=1 Tax=candidate division CPR3 bacterium TaxID=2268181 RepID=A0A7C4M214_UNCC3